MEHPVEDVGTSSAFSDFDHHDQSMTAGRVWATYRHMHERCPVAHSDRHGGFWVLTRHADVVAAARAHETFSSADGVRVPVVGDNRAIPIDFDQPLHTAYRKLFTQAITPRVAKAKEQATSEFLHERVGRIVAAGGGELISELALPLPLWMLSEIVGLSPEVTEQLRPLTEQSWRRISTQPMAAARAAIYELLGREYDSRPGRTDYIGWLRDEATVDGRSVTRAEAVNALVGFAIAGHETTLNAVGNLLYQLAIAPELQRRLRSEPELIPGVVEESLRLRAPAHLFGRVVTTDTEIGGVRIGAGERVLLAYAAANRDPDRFPDPDTFDPDRGDRHHLSFGFGIHQCSGAPLARMELRTLLAVLADFEDFELDGPAQFSHLEGGHHLGPRKLPVRFVDAQGWSA